MLDFKQHIRTVHDFPEKGILFYDISPLLKNHWIETIHAMAALFEDWDNIDGIVGIDARGFLFASSLAFYKQKQLLMVRKPGKLPPPTQRIDYTLEYGKNSLEMQAGFGNVIIIDDVLATGGTLEATAELCLKSGYTVHGLCSFINLKKLNNFEWRGLKCQSVVEYD